MSKAANLYREAMIEVKLSFRAADRIIGAKKPRTLTEGFDNEVLWLHIRRIVELVTFGGIIADEKRYAALRAGTPTNSDYTQDWKVNKILPKLEQITPIYLPVSIGPLQQMPDGTMNFSGGDETLSHQRMIEIYNAAGEHLHAKNPLRADLNIFDDVALSRERACLELAFLKKVLWQHAKIGLAYDVVESPTLGAHPDTAWIFRFGNPSTADVEMMTAEGVPLDDARQMGFNG